jgi:tetratricopeptide (TPR) repeat protein
MKKRRRFRIFISAVTAELGSYRQALAKELRRKGLDVCDQEHFRQGDATLLEALRDYIKECDAVVLLIGHRCGALAAPEHAAALADVAGFKAYSAASGQQQASYTQWEFHLAKHYGKKTYTFFAEAGFVADPAEPEPADLQACQQAHRQWIKRLGEHRDLLTTSDRLVIDMLVQDFPSDPATKPVKLPYRSIGTLFKGRDAFVAQLRKSLATGENRGSAIVNAVHGLGGIGKTRLAVEYAWQRHDDYNALLFVGANSPADLQRNLAALTGPMVLSLDDPPTEEEARVAAALRWLQQNPGWFLILDNVDTKEAAEAAETLLAKLHGGNVLITSRLANWSAQVEPLQLDVLTHDDAVSFLMERTDRRRRKTATDAADARTLAADVGELALALEQAGAYIYQHRMSFAGYLERWHATRAQVMEWFDPRLMQYPQSLAVTWQASFDQLSGGGRRLLERLAWLAPDPIPESLLDVPIAAQGAPAEDLHGALAELEAYSLVMRDSEAPIFTVHRLVQDVTRRRLAGEARGVALGEALAWVHAGFVADPADVRTWLVLEPLAPHAAVVAQHADHVQISSPTARLMNALGRLYYNKALHGLAEPLLRRALEIDEATYGRDHPEVAGDLNALAFVLIDTNRIGQAEPMLRRALAICEASFGRDHADLVALLNNLADLLRATNRPGKAETMFRQVISILEKVERDTGKQPANYTDVLSNLAVLLQETNQLEEAEGLMRRALAIDEASLGLEHSKVAIRLNNLGQLLVDTHRLGEAEPMMRRVVSIFEKAYGPEHPRYATGLNNLAQLLAKSDRRSEAEPLLWRALQIDETCFGPDHPDVARDLTNLARLLQATNRLEEAERLMRRSLTIFLNFTRSTRHRHPNLQAALGNFGEILEAMGRSKEEVYDEIETLVRAAGLEVKIPGRSGRA